MVGWPASKLIGPYFNAARKLLHAGYGADTTYGMLRSFYPDVRRSIIRQISAMTRLEDVNSILIGRYHQTGQVPADLINISQWNQQSAFQYQFTMTGYDATTGQLSTSIVSFASDSQISAQEARDRLMDMIADNAKNYNLQDITLRLTNVYARPDAL